MDRPPQPRSEFGSRPGRGRNELRDLERAEEREPLDRRGLFAACLAGIALVLALGFGTGLFQSGPTQADLERAFQRGAARGEAATEAEWRQELERRGRVGFARGRGAASTLSEEDVDSFRHGFTYEAAYDQVQQLAEQRLRESWDDGWRAGYRAAWQTIRGAPPSGEIPMRP